MNNLHSGPPSKKLSEQSVTPNNNSASKAWLCVYLQQLWEEAFKIKTDLISSLFLNKTLLRTSIFHNESQNLQ